jgi:hypothetical protein
VSVFSGELHLATLAVVELCDPIERKGLGGRMLLQDFQTSKSFNKKGSQQDSLLQFLVRSTLQFLDHLPAPSPLSKCLLKPPPQFILLTLRKVPAALSKLPLTVLKLQPRRMGNGSTGQNKDPISTVWRMCLSYDEPHTVFEV